MDMYSAVNVPMEHRNDYGAMPFFNTSPSASDSTSSPHNYSVPLNMRSVTRSASDPDLNDRDQQLPAHKRQKLLYFCDSCGTSYTEKRALARHKHTNQHRRNLGLPPAQRYHCTSCEKSFSRDHDRVRHENETHKGLKRAPQRATASASSVQTDASPRNDSLNNSDNPSPNEPDSLLTPESSAASHSRTYSHLYSYGYDGNDWVGSTPDLARSQTSYSNYSRPLGYATSNSSFKTSSTRGENVGTSEMHDRTWFVDNSDSDDQGHNAKLFRLVRGKSNDMMEDDDDDDDDKEDEERVNRTLYPTVRSTSATADSAIDLDWSQDREPKFPTITTHDHRSGSTDHSVDMGEQEDELAPLSDPLPSPRQLRGHTSVIARQGKLQTVAAKTPLFCAFCKKSFEEDADSLLAHLREHMDSFKGQHHCKACNISFTHRADLDRHKASVDFFGYCGFPFHHSRQCTGHHPPSSRHLPHTLNDRDSVQMFAQLRNWEHAQLRTYITEIQQLVTKRPSRVSTCYSVEALFRRSRDSFASMAVSVKTCDTAPCDGDGDVKRGMSGLQQRLRMMSLKNSSSTNTTSKGLSDDLKSASRSRVAT